MRPVRTGGHGGHPIRDVVVVVAVALLASLLIKTFLVRSFFIPSASMERTLLGDPGHHDRILVDELVPNPVPLQRGDVIVFRDPGGWLPSRAAAPLSPLAAAAGWASSLTGLMGPDSDDHLVKRVIGLPGDHVTCCDASGRLSVDGVPVTEPYVQLPAGSTAVSLLPFDVHVPAGDLWVMGDDRYDSADSRAHPDTPDRGFVPIGDVTGRAVVVSWPVSRWRVLSDFPESWRGVSAAAGSRGASH